MFSSNSATNGKFYGASPVDENTKAYYNGYQVFAISSVVSPLSYGEVLEKVAASLPAYDSKNTRNAKTEIIPDSLYADERVKLYLLGSKEHKTVFMKMKPKSTEEEHKSVIFMFTHE